MLKPHDAQYGKRSSWVFGYCLPLRPGPKDDFGKPTQNPNHPEDWGCLCELCFNQGKPKCIYYSDTKSLGDHLWKMCVSVRILIAFASLYFSSSYLAAFRRLFPAVHHLTAIRHT